MQSLERLLVGEMIKLGPEVLRRKTHACGKAGVAEGNCPGHCKLPAEDRVNAVASLGRNTAQ